MPTLQDLINDFESLTNHLQGHVETNMIITANDGIALVVERLSETGKDASGSPFPDYTDAYKRLKIKKHRYKGFVDFQFTGRMLANLQVTGELTEFGSVKVKVGNTGADNIAKMESNVKKRGTILAFSSKEESDLGRGFDDRFQNFVRQQFKF